MNKTLNLFEHLLAMGRRYQDGGRANDAIRILGRLASLRDIPAATAEETQVRLAELQLHRRKYARARRHLAIALVHQPDSARLNHLMATATQADDRGDLDVAADYFRRAIALDPESVPCLAEGGLLAVRLGQTEEGLALLRRAALREPDNAEVIGKLAKGLRLAGQGGEARAVLRSALFRNPRCGRIRRLWNEFQFRRARARQQNQQRRPRFARDNGPVLLSFEAVRRDDPQLRLDGPEPIARPHLPRRSRRTDQRHVQ